MKRKIKLTPAHSEYLSMLPEQGMGYQIVDITLKNGKVLENLVVYNSSDLEVEGVESSDIDDIILKPPEWSN